MASDLLLDPQIRLWVVVPIAVIAFCIGLCRQYVMLLIRNARPHADLDKLREEYVPDSPTGLNLHKGRERERDGERREKAPRRKVQDVNGAVESVVEKLQCMFSLPVLARDARRSKYDQYAQPGEVNVRELERERTLREEAGGKEEDEITDKKTTEHIDTYKQHENHTEALPLNVQPPEKPIEVS